LNCKPSGRRSTASVSSGFGHLVAGVEQQVESEFHLSAHLKRDRRQLRRDHDQFGAKSMNIRKYCVQS
jgi:hypothetical protein